MNPTVGHSRVNPSVALMRLVPTSATIATTNNKYAKNAPIVTAYTLVVASHGGLQRSVIDRTGSLVTVAPTQRQTVTPRH